MSFLTLEQVTVRYESEPVVVALDDVSIEVEAGEVVAVVGPSGCGKSTMLRAVAGLEPVASGRVVLDGQDLAGVPTHHRDLGLMFQDHVLFPHLSVADNIGFGLKMKNQAVSEQSTRISELLDLVGLSGFADRTVDQLSGGEAQRVALARAVAPSPRLLMLDEPLGSLDRLLREQLTGDLRRLIDQLGVTALHVTHDQVEAFALADRVVVMRDGRVAQVGSPSELWRQPASVFVAEFLGHPNLWVRGDDTLLVPVDAIHLDDAGARSAVVELVEFREGRFRVSARSDDDHPGDTVVFETNTTCVAGQGIRFVYDTRQAHTLAGTVGQPEMS